MIAKNFNVANLKVPISPTAYANYNLTLIIIIYYSQGLLNSQYIKWANYINIITTSLDSITTQVVNNTFLTVAVAHYHNCLSN